MDESDKLLLMTLNQLGWYVVYRYYILSLFTFK